MYVTYDLQQGDSETALETASELVRCAKKVALPGELIDWKVGEFKMASGKKAYGVQYRYRQESREVVDLVEVPAHAQNVQVHSGAIPKIYEEALTSAA